MKYHVIILLLISLLITSSLCGVVNAETTITYYANSNGDNGANINKAHPGAFQSAAGESFILTGEYYKLERAEICMYKQGTPPGLGHLVLYNGTSGANSIPTGSALATSNDFNLTQITGLTWATRALYSFTFSGINQYVLVPNTPYCIVYENPAAGDFTSNFPYVIYDESSPTYSGNYIYYDSGWAPQTSKDMVFYLYGSVYYPPVSISTEVIIDSFTPLVADGLYLELEHPTNDTSSYFSSAWGQAFTSTETGFLSRATFRLAKMGNPSCILVARLYDATGTYGVNMTPTVIDTPYLAQSITSISDSILTTSFQDYNFTFDGTCLIVPKYYCIAIISLNYYGTPGTDRVKIWIDMGDFTPVHDGNAAWFFHSAWLYGWDHTAYDVYFIVYAAPPPAPFSLPYYVPLLGKCLDLIGSLGVVALVYSNIKDIKSGVKGAVIILIVFAIFISVWYVLTTLEVYT